MNWARLSVGEQMGAEDRERLSAGKRPAWRVAMANGAVSVHVCLCLQLRLSTNCVKKRNKALAEVICWAE
jgi:hypothetical protein